MGTLTTTTELQIGTTTLTLIMLNIRKKKEKLTLDYQEGCFLRYGMDLSGFQLPRWH